MDVCPNCHAQYSLDTECVDQEEWFGDSYYNYCRGTCACCGKTYRWTEIYRFSEVIDIEEVTED